MKACMHTHRFTDTHTPNTTNPSCNMHKSFTQISNSNHKTFLSKMQFFLKTKRYLHFQPELFWVWDKRLTSLRLPHYQYHWPTSVLTCNKWLNLTSHHFPCWHWHDQQGTQHVAGCQRHKKIIKAWFESLFHVHRNAHQYVSPHSEDRNEKKADEGPIEIVTNLRRRRGTVVPAEIQLEAVIVGYVIIALILQCGNVQQWGLNFVLNCVFIWLQLQNHVKFVYRIFWSC